MVTGFWVTFYGVLGVSGCSGTRGDAHGCMGAGILLLAAGAPLAVALIAWALRGKGALHSLLGATLGPVIGIRLAGELLRATGSHESELAGLALSAFLTAALVALWAEFGPGTRTSIRKSSGR